MSRGKGLHRTPDAKKAHRLGANLHPLIATALAAGIKGAGMLAIWGVLNQGGSQTCAEHSDVGAVWATLTAQGKAPAFIGSPRTLASCVYGDLRAAATPAGQTLPLLTDGGCDLQDTATALAKWGLAPMQAPTSDGRNSDVENDPSDNTFPEPDPQRVVLAGQDLCPGEYSVPVDQDAARTVAACIDAGIAVHVGGFIDTAYENLTASQVAQPANDTDPNGGGHAQYVYGYRTAADGSLEFRVANSWGADWCDGGSCWVSTAWLLSMWEIFPVAVGVPATARAS